jgi:hypothetical protein
METITVTEKTGRKIRIPREAIWRLEGNSVFGSGPREPTARVSLSTAFRGFAGAFLCDIWLFWRRSYQELRDLISNQSEAN